MSAAKGKMSIQPDDMRCFRLEDFELSASDQMKLKKLHVRLCEYSTNVYECKFLFTTLLH